MSQQVFPNKFTYDEQTKELTVEFADGSVVRYFEIDPRSAFLDIRNPRRNRDFLVLVNQRVINPYHHRDVCRPAALSLQDASYCACPFVIKREVIQEATNELLQAQTRPLLAAQQNGVNGQQRMLTYPDTGNRTRATI
jgi:KTSC domain